MDSGGFSVALRADAAPLQRRAVRGPARAAADRDQLQLLIEAAQADWRDVEPAIFGTLLERALDPAERHKLGAHFTPRAYVERLVLPTIIEPLRAEWETAQAAALRAGRSEGKADGGAAGRGAGRFQRSWPACASSTPRAARATSSTSRSST